MNQLHRLQEIIKRVTYKKGWRLTAAMDRFPNCGIISLFVTVTIPDANNLTLPPLMICRSNTITEWELEQLSDAQIVEFPISTLIRDMEAHEFAEWLKFDGVCIRNPHPEVEKI